ncbi:MAG: hypothetical protein ACI86H_001924 [bacterium]|jgi:hypothetical protein
MKTIKAFLFLSILFLFLFPKWEVLAVSQIKESKIIGQAYQYGEAKLLTFKNGKKEIQFVSSKGEKIKNLGITFNKKTKIIRYSLTNVSKNHILFLEASNDDYRVFSYWNINDDILYTHTTNKKTGKVATSKSYRLAVGNTIIYDYVVKNLKNRILKRQILLSLNKKYKGQFSDDYSHIIWDAPEGKYNFERASDLGVFIVQKKEFVDFKNRKKIFVLIGIANREDNRLNLCNACTIYLGSAIFRIGNKKIKLKRLTKVLKFPSKKALISRSSTTIEKIVSTAKATGLAFMIKSSACHQGDCNHSYHLISQVSKKLKVVFNYESSNSIEYSFTMNAESFRFYNLTVREMREEEDNKVQEMKSTLYKFNGKRYKEEK